MQRLYRVRQLARPRDEDLPDRLPGLSGLSRLSRIEIDYGKAQTCLGSIAAALGWTDDQIPGLAGIAHSIGPFRAASTEQQSAGTAHPDGGELRLYRQAVLDGHLLLLKTFNAEGANFGKAYNMGRALADTCRPSQHEADLQDGFDPYRLTQLQQDLHDLASVLPAHSAKAVVRSLAWWRDAIYLADDSAVGQNRRKLVGNVRTDAPAFRRPTGILNPRLNSAPTRGDLKSLARALTRQGELWRLVLTGDKKPTDLLVAEDYVSAAQRAVAGGRRIASRTVLAAPKTTATVLVAVTLVLAAVLWVIDQSHASSGGKLAAFLVAVAGYLGSVGRAAVPRLRVAVRAVEQPLWFTALDYVIAEAISIPPVGRADTAGWSRLAGFSPTKPKSAASSGESTPPKAS